MTSHLNATTAFESIPSSGLLQPPMAEPLGGDTATWTREMWATADEASSAGFWQASAGRSYWKFDYTEVIFVLEGRLIVTEDDGEAVELGPGDTAVFPTGWQGEWNIVDEMKKFYVVFP